MSQVSPSQVGLSQARLAQHGGGDQPVVSVVVPVKNESGNIAPLVAEIAAALAGRAFEIVYVNDGSTDATEQELGALMRERSWLRQIRHQSSCGQSAAIRTGVAMARAALVVTIDGDGQNDPAFIPALIAAFAAGSPRVGLIAGQRVGRKATAFKKLQSRIANAIRSTVLKDGTRDTGCGLKAFGRDLFLSLPYFDGLHRFLPALIRREGLDIAYVEVVDRPRRHGKSNYGFWDRLWIGMVDLFGVWWLIRRKKRIPQSVEVTLAH
ncbi:MAG TPA: glycosyltransferase family 2 protein [Xanthobacteraceae bacterium]|jgi:dolichol-phosphate mannosyltransferase